MDLDQVIEMYNNKGFDVEIIRENISITRIYLRKDGKRTFYGGYEKALSNEEISKGLEDDFEKIMEWDKKPIKIVRA